MKKVVLLSIKDKSLIEWLIKSTLEIGRNINFNLEEKNIANFTIKAQNIPGYFQNGKKIEKYEKSIDNKKIFKKESYPDLIAFIFNQLFHALYSNQNILFHFENDEDIEINLSLEEDKEIIDASHKTLPLESECKNFKFIFYEDNIYSSLKESKLVKINNLIENIFTSDKERQKLLNSYYYLILSRHNLMDLLTMKLIF